MDEDYESLLRAFDPGAPGAAVLQDGRNLTVRAPLGSADAVVKRFPAPSAFRALLDRIAGKPSKAVRSFRAAKHLSERVPGPPPEPLAVLDGGRRAPGFFATRFEAGTEAFSERLGAIFRAQGPGPELIALLERVARACRAVHDAGFFHGDLGDQNVLLAPDGRVLFIDLNRSRLFEGGLANDLRARDLSRIALPSDFLRVFFEMYWDAPPPADFLRRERACRRRFARHTATRRWRHPFRPRKPSGGFDWPAPQDLWIWDPRSEQALVTMRPKDRRRYMSSSRVLRPLAELLRHAGPLRRHLRSLRSVEFARPVFHFANRAFVSVSADPARFDRELEVLDRLGAPGVHLRFYAHEDDATTAFKIAAALRLRRERGRAVALSLVQDRRAVREPAGRWRDFCERVLDALHADAIWVEYLHAVNRVKWGIWNYAELGELLAILPGLRRKYRDVAFLAPSAIDFEWDYVAGALPLLPRGPAPLVGLSAELYVDRRGRPEARQGRHDAPGKLRLLRALAMCHGRALEPRLVVTEFNWPLAGTGVWSPVGAPYVSPGPRFGDPSVSEEDAAAFAVRYLLLGLASGHADGMVFWSLAAHGFGLVDPGTGSGAPWRERPAFAALRFFYASLLHAHYAGKARRGGPDGVWILHFRDAEGRPLAVAWTAGPSPAPPPGPDDLGFAPSSVCGLSGDPLPASAPLTGAPNYYFASPR